MADDQITDDQDLDTDADADADADVDAGADADADADADSKTNKRVSDLQSQKDAETARANKLEKQLEALTAKPDEPGKPGGNDPERAALMQELREASLDAVLGEYPELKQYGIDRGLIEGRTRAEMRESATSLVGLIKSVATKARNQALRDAGITAEPADTTRKQPKNYATMDQKDFEKELARVKGGSSLYG